MTALTTPEPRPTRIDWTPTMHGLRADMLPLTEAEIATRPTRAPSPDFITPQGNVSDDAAHVRRAVFRAGRGVAMLVIVFAILAAALIPWAAGALYLAGILP